VVTIGAALGLGACGGGGAELRSEGGADASDVANEGSDGRGAIDGDTACGPIDAPSAWARWIMPNPVKSGLPNPASYTVADGGNLVVDEVTGLNWQRNVDSRFYTWDEAKQACACLLIDGMGGFRLPSRIELVSLADWTSVPSIDAIAFPNTAPESFWTSSALVSTPGLSWLVSFDAGFSTYSDVVYPYRARCVRGGVTTGHEERYTVANGTAHDAITKLTWQQEMPTSLFNWNDAGAYCSALQLDGGGWRLPATGELQTIVDESSNPSIDGAVFPATPSEYFWSSSPVVGDPSRVWTCFFANGSTYRFALSKPQNVRCVR
jgi:hypothetical protein